MNLNRIDLNLLIVFEAVMKERSVTRAAQLLGLSQPAVSSSLCRLRRIVGDPLLVRTSHGMVPTPRAERLIVPVKEGLLTIRTGINEQSRFDPAAAQRTFHLLVSDIGEMIYLPRLVEHVRRLGQGIRIEVSPGGSRHDAEVLSSGTADLAIGTLLHLRQGFEQERLFTESFVCMMRTDHPTIGKTLSLEQYLDAEHAVIASRGLDDGIVQQTLSDMGLTRKVALRVPHFLAVPTIVARTNLIVTVPGRLGTIFTQTPGTRLLPLPFAMRTIEIRQYWHRRFSNDASNRWLRGVIDELFAEPARAGDRPDAETAPKKRVSRLVRA